jgi:hypothetical protein
MVNNTVVITGCYSRPRSTSGQWVPIECDTPGCECPTSRYGSLAKLLALVRDCKCLYLQHANKLREFLSTAGIFPS